jgi:hypothetical protein
VSPSVYVSDGQFYYGSHVPGDTSAVSASLHVSTDTKEASGNTTPLERVVVADYQIIGSILAHKQILSTLEPTCDSSSVSNNVFDRELDRHAKKLDLGRQAVITITQTLCQFVNDHDSNHPRPVITPIDINIFMRSGAARRHKTEIRISATLVRTKNNLSLDSPPLPVLWMSDQSQSTTTTPMSPSVKQSSTSKVMIWRQLQVLERQWRRRGRRRRWGSRYLGVLPQGGCGKDVQREGRGTLSPDYGDSVGNQASSDGSGWKGVWLELEVASPAQERRWPARAADN